MQGITKQFTQTINHEGVCSFASRLRDDLDAGRDPERLRQQAVRFWKEHLEDYLNQEQALILPRLRRLRANMLSWNLQKEHRQIAHLMWYLWYPRTNCRDTLYELADVLASHNAFKEHELLPFLENHLDDQTFERITKAFFKDDGIRSEGFDAVRKTFRRGAGSQQSVS